MKKLINLILGRKPETKERKLQALAVLDTAHCSFDTMLKKYW